MPIELKTLAVRLSLTVLADATIIRGVLLPASMQVLGDWNWYLPKWLEWLPEVREPELPGPEAAPQAGGGSSPPGPPG